MHELERFAHSVIIPIEISSAHHARFLQGKEEPSWIKPRPFHWQLIARYFPIFSPESFFYRVYGMGSMVSFWLACRLPYHTNQQHNKPVEAKSGRKGRNPHEIRNYYYIVVCPALTLVADDESKPSARGHAWQTTKAEKKRNHNLWFLSHFLISKVRLCQRQRARKSTVRFRLICFFIQLMVRSFDC